jgi:ferredoxin/flavodoxin
MDTRRSFIRTISLTVAMLSLTAALPTASRSSYPPLRTRDPRKALVLWYSQTGFTARYGKLIACKLREKGLNVEAGEIGDFDRTRLPDYDLIVIGSPVFYYDIPENVSQWIDRIPPIKGTPVASFVSFGGPEGNQRHAACHTLNLLSDKGGVPVDMAAFMNVASYPTPSWDTTSHAKHRHLPNNATYDDVRHFTARILERVARGETTSAEYGMTMRDFLRILPLVRLNKLAITRHTIDGGKCTACGTCVRKCPTKAINPAARAVDAKKCLACFGCLNNCPADAVIMEYTGKRLYGFPEFLRRNSVSILEPPEFLTCRQS